MNIKNLKKRVNQELFLFTQKKIYDYKISQTDPLLSAWISEFIMRDGKRVRPILFILSYLAFSKKAVLNKNILKISLAFELLHDFLLIHDDIIDNSSTRRGKPTLHKVIQRLLKQTAETGKNLGIIAGDIIYAMAIDAFLNSKSNHYYQQRGLHEFLTATALTGIGEYKDVTNGLTPIKKIKLKDIHLNYLLKTAEYTFKAPLVCGAIFAGAKKTQIEKISRYGKLLGEAFQIHDDLIGIFGQSKKIGKSVLSDIREAKKTLPLFLAYQTAIPLEKKFIENCLGNQNLKIADLEKIRKIIINTKAKSKTDKKIQQLLNSAQIILQSLNLNQKFKQLFSSFIISFMKI
ncbi:MAG: polyprenyl synthetase family protein [Candidatus Omnitrophota bacterium]